MKNKRIEIIILMFITSLVFSFSACGNDPVEKFDIKYSAGGGGVIKGKTYQTIDYGGNTESVTAVADEGYVFIKWSDGLTEATRTDTNITAALSVKAEFEGIPFSISVTYNAGTGGSISGKASQILFIFGAYAEAVTAVPNPGYRFVKWSDGLKTATRHDDYVTADINVTAEFEWRIQDVYTYNYNLATANNTQSDIKLERGKLHGVTLAVPEREYFSFDGWYLDKNFNTQIADKKGNLVLGDEIFNNHSTDLHAKWTANEVIATYKILMVYVTEVKAALTSADGTVFYVNYKMSKLEKEFCDAITIQFENYLNATLDGLIKFEVDSYFTSTIAGVDNIYKGETVYSDGTIMTTHYISAEDIPELSGILDNYRSVITTFSFDHYDGLLFQASGYGNEKYAMIHFDRMIKGLLLNGEPLERLFDFTHNDWYDILALYAHEFTHTIEQGIVAYEFHDAIKKSENMGEIEVIKKYLLNQLIIKEEKVGIPLTYWTNEIFIVTYRAIEGGYVTNDWRTGWVMGGTSGTRQRIPKGSRAGTMIAVANENYRFIGWSDGVTTATRTDTNIQSDFSVTAYFERIA